MAVNVSNSRNALIASPLDTKLVNYYIDEYSGNYIIETISDYLTRVEFEHRFSGVIVSVLVPKVGITPNMSYVTTEDFNIGLNYFDIKQYAFIGGLLDENFVEFLTPGRSYHHVQSNPSRVWEITHNLNKYPTVIITDNDNNEYEGEIKKIDENNIVITFSTAFSGYADLN